MYLPSDRKPSAISRVAWTVFWIVVITFIGIWSERQRANSITTPDDSIQWYDMRSEVYENHYDSWTKYRK